MYVMRIIMMSAVWVGCTYAMEVADESKKLLGDIELMRIQHATMQEKNESALSLIVDKKPDAVQQNAVAVPLQKDKPKKPDYRILLPCGGITGAGIGSIVGIPVACCTQYAVWGYAIIVAGAGVGLLS